MIQGQWDKAWQPVVEAFAQNFSEMGEQGAALAIYCSGEPVVNIWAGVRQNQGAGVVDQPWQEDTCVNIFSVGKALVALARVFGALAEGGRLGDAQLLSAAQCQLCSRELSAEDDRVLGLRLRFGHGFMLPQDRPDCRFGRGATAFGHPGAGGSLGFADPDYHLGFGYVTSRMGQSLLIDSRVIRLIDAAYQDVLNI